MAARKAFVSLLALFSLDTEEPKHEVLLTPTNVDFSYEIRSYGTRIAAETKDDEDAFQVLAAYIGVGGDPQNVIPNADIIESETVGMTSPVITSEDASSESISMTAPVITSEATTSESISMTAPVVTSEDSTSETIPMTAPVVTSEDATSETIPMTAPVVVTEQSSETISMTAPVVTTEESSETISMTAPVVTTEDSSESISMTAPVITEDTESDVGYMQFILPDKYTTIEEAPQPLNEDVWLVEIPPVKGAVHRFTCSGSKERFDEKYEELKKQLESDLGEPLTDVNTVQKMQYDAPFTPLMLRKNEIFIVLTEEQVDKLVEKHSNRKFLR